MAAPALGSMVEWFAFVHFVLQEPPGAARTLEEVAQSIADLWVHALFGRIDLGTSSGRRSSSAQGAGLARRSFAWEKEPRMQHMVIYRASDGRPLNHQTDDIDGAVKFVEHLRNEEQVAEAAIYQMMPVPIAFKTYYRVEVAAAEPAPPAIQVAAPQAAAATAAAATAAANTVAVSPPAEQPVPVAVGAPAASGAPEASGATDAGGKAQIVAPTPVGNGRFGLFSRG